MIAWPASSTSERLPRMSARPYRSNSTSIRRISSLASRSRTGAPGCFRTGLSSSAETFPRKSRSSSGPPIIAPVADLFQQQKIKSTPWKSKPSWYILTHARPHRASRSPAVGLEAYGSDCGRGGEQPRPHALQAGGSHRGDPQGRKSNTREYDNLVALRNLSSWTDRRQAVCLFISGRTNFRCGLDYLSTVIRKVESELLWTGQCAHRGRLASVEQDR